MTAPVSTYRIQVRRAFGLVEATALIDYLVALGADWAYLSPILQATEGSDHGYDVVDPSRVDLARGGAEALAEFSRAAHAAGLGVIVDIVPNHMGVSDPVQNPWWWDLLIHGQGSRYARAFDVDWEFGAGKVRLPVLGSSAADAAAAGELRVDGDELRYFDHRFPLAPGTVSERERPHVEAEHPESTAILAVLARQHYELMNWRREADELNYRRFFTVSSLAGIRVEDDEVFDEAHAEVKRWFDEGLVDGLRVDHPDGLRQPGDYLDRLSKVTGGAYVVVEKILEHGEDLPPFWRTAGTTGYDALGEIDRVLIDPAGETALDALDARLHAETGVEALSWQSMIAATKRMNADSSLRSEVLRLDRELDPPVPGGADALAELLTRFPVYRSYLPAGVEHLAAAEAAARAARPDLATALDAVVLQLRDARHLVALRFEQTSGMVMAKGVEDTAFYRFTRLGTLTEVGGDPAVFALQRHEFHAAQERRQAGWPMAMTTLSTHDTKRGEDVRARLAVLAELPERWADVLTGLRDAAGTGHGPFDALLWQAIIGAWPASRERLHAYAEKASREAGERTTWLAPDVDFERRVHALVDAAFDTAEASALVESFVDEITPFGWSNSLAAKIIQLTAPGVPDVYQGSELWDPSLVDPDNRRAVDFALRRRLLAEIDGGARPAIDGSGAAKLLVVSRALRLRRDRPELFTRYAAATVVGPAAAHAIAFDRGGALTVATRLPVGLARRGVDPWKDTVLLRPAGPATDVITGASYSERAIPLARLFADYPIALLAEDPA